MLGLNTITLISSRVGSFIKRIVTDGLKMRLPFTSAKPLGENVVTNGDFATDSNWNLSNVTGGGASINTNDNTLVFTNGLGYVQSNDYILENGKTYIVKIDIESVSSGLIKVVAGADGSTYSPDYTAGGLYIHYFTPNTTHGKFEIYTGSSSTGAVINSVSVEEHTQETPDISNNDNDAILKTGKCLEFSGGNDYVNINGLNVYTNEATFAFWAKPADNPSTASDIIIDLGPVDRFFISVAENRWKVYQYGSGSAGVVHDPKWKVITNKWQRVVVSIDKNNYVSVYRDGVLLTDPRLLTKPLNLSGKTEAAIGASHYKVHNFYSGYLSDVQVYNKVWNSDDVTYDYKNPQSLVTDNVSSDIHLRNLKAWWHMSEGSGTIAFDSAPLIGKELTVNGDFSTDSDWSVIDQQNTSSSGWGINNSSANYDGSGSQYNRIYQVLNTVVGKTYKMTFTLSGLSSSGVNFGFGSSGGSFVNPQVTYNANGTYTRYMVADRTDHSVVIQNNSATQTFSIDSISIKEVYNIDGETYDGSTLGATYDDAQETIPQLGMMNWSKGSNLIAYSEDLTEWSELAGAVVSFDSSIVNPDSTVGCYKVTYDGTFRGRIEYNVPLDGTVTQSVYLKVDTGTETVKIGGGSGDLGDVTVTDEWQRFSHTATYTATSTNPRVRCDNSATIYVWGVQYEAGTTASAYRRTNGLPVTNSTLIKTPDVEQFTGNKVTRNLLLQSEDFSNNYWQGLNNVTTEGGYAAPDGTLSAYKLTDNTGAGNFANITVSFHPLNISNYSRSIWARTTSGSGTVNLLSRFDDTNSVFTLTDEWQRFDISSTSSALSETIFYLVDFRGGDLDEVILWGAQLQEGGLTPYFPTYGAIAQETLPIIGKDILGNDVESRSSALNLDGTGYAEVLDDASINPTTAITIGCWVYFKGNKNDLGIVGKWEANKTNYLITQIFDGSNRRLRFYLGTTGGVTSLSSPAIVGDKWVYVACTYNKDAGTNNTKIYTIIPGNLDGSGNQIIEKGIGTHTGSINDSDNNITIGQYTYAASTFFDDKIDDVKIYNTDLSEAQIEQNFNATKSAHTN